MATTNQPTRKVLIVPANQPGRGTGHLKRSLRLAGALEKKNCDIWFLEQTGEGASRLTSLLPADSRLISEIPSNIHFDCIIWDNYRTSYKTLLKYLVDAPLIGIDEGGAARSRFHYLADSLPVSAKLGPANRSTGLPLSQELQHKPAFPPEKVLLSFGGEDHAGLSAILARFLIEAHFFEPAQITVIKGQFFQPRSWPRDIVLLDAQENLASLFGDYDLLFTHFGLTCFEALGSGLPVILFNPTSYHALLSRQCALPEIGIRRPAGKKLKKWLQQKQDPVSLLQKLAVSYPSNIETLPDWLSSFALSGNLKCPVCATRFNPVVGRFTERTYFRCRSCHLVYLTLFTTQRNFLYTEAYFFDQYKAQYGKTYLEDFPTLKKMAIRRLEVIGKIAGNMQGKKLLDVGCAYGPFLQAFQASGGEPLGLEIAREAVEYVKGTLGLQAFCADFTVIGPAEILPQASFDLLTMWYVIEHFPALGNILTRVNRLLTFGGIFAFSTPSGSGISARTAYRCFLEASPGDHYTLWQPENCRRILKRFGLRVEKIVITGHHPERFPLLKSAQPGSAAWRFKAGLSRLAHWGDTFEVYARKVKEIEDC